MATALGAVLVVVAGCGDLTSGGVGDLDVVVAADSVPIDATGVPSAPRLPEAPSSPGDLQDRPSRQTGPSDLAGTLTLSIQVFVLHPPYRMVEVTDGPQMVVLDLESTEPMTLASATVPAGRYRGVRTVFRRVEANVVRGLVVDGQPVTGLVRVQLGSGGALVVDDPTEVEVPAGGEASLLVDLHTTRWLRLLNLELRQVAASDFQNQVRLRPRP
jgi:hypothetical protein